MAKRKKQEVETLTKAEEQVMKAVWKVGKGFAGNIASAVDEPKPAYRTIISTIRLLEQKGFVAHKDYNGNNQYYPIVSKQDYSGKMLGALLNNYFNASYSSLVSFFLNDKDISKEDLEALGRIIEEKKGKM